MPHEQIVPQKTVDWDCIEFFGRRIEKDDSWIGFSYARFLDANDIKPGRNYDKATGRFSLHNELCNRFFWEPTQNGGRGGFQMDDGRVVAALRKVLSQPLTESEYINTRNLEYAREVMAGVSMFGGLFTVTPLEVTRE